MSGKSFDAAQRQHDSDEHPNYYEPDEPEPKSRCPYCGHRDWMLENCQFACNYCGSRGPTGSNDFEACQLTDARV